MLARDFDDLDRTLLRRARVHVRDADGALCVRLRGFSPFMVFVTVLIIGIVVVGFLYPIAAMAAHPNPIPGSIIMCAAALIPGAALFLAFRAHLRHAAGLEDLRLNDTAGRLSLPATFGRDNEEIIDLQDIHDVTFGEETPRSIDCIDADAFVRQRYHKRKVVPDEEIPRTDHRGEIRYVVLVEWADASKDVRCEPIVAWTERRRANAFAHWLRRRVGLERSDS